MNIYKRILLCFFVCVLMFSVVGCNLSNRFGSNFYPPDSTIDPMIEQENPGEQREPKPLEGKTVVCFGDSIFGMNRDITGVPAIVGIYTGAKVYNVGFGGCRMAVHPYEGYGEFSMWALSDAVAGGDWSVQDAAVSKGSAYFYEQLVRLKSIDFQTVDIVVIHYGTNDFYNWGNHLDNVDDPMDHTTVCGALRYSIDNLQKAYPHLKIYISLPIFRYWVEEDGTVVNSDTYINKLGYTFLEGGEAIARVAREYDLPVIDGYHDLEISADNASSYYMDGTHLNEAGRALLGALIAECLIDTAQ